MGLLDGDIATIIGNAFSSTFYACTVTRKSYSGGDAWDKASQTETSTDYTCKGMVDTFTNKERENSKILESDRKILILATSLSITPDPKDTITIRSVTYAIVAIDTDPALAVWVIAGRG